MSTTKTSSSRASGIGRPAFSVGRLDGHEQIVIPVRWPGMAILSLIVTLPIWIVAASLKFLVPALVGGRASILLVLGGCTVVFVVAALLQIVWWLGGAERIAVIGRDLLIRHTLFRVPVTTRSFRGQDIRHLAASGMREEGWLREPWPPFLSSTRIGGVKFSYREALVYLAYDMEEAAAREIVAWLAQRLPGESTR